MSDELPSTPDDHTLHVQQLFVRHQQAVLAYVLSIEPSAEDAQEIVQEVFLTVSRKAPTWTDGTNFLAWVCTIARYKTLHYQRTRLRRTARLDDDVVELLFATEMNDFPIFQHQVAILQRCLDRLAPRMRELVRLRYHGGRMPEQIATELSWTANAVRVALTRARIALRDCLQRQLAREDS